MMLTRQFCQVPCLLQQLQRLVAGVGEAHLVPVLPMGQPTAGLVGQQPTLHMAAKYAWTLSS